MADAAFFESTVMQKILMMQVCFPATVLLYDDVLEEAKIQPLLKTKSYGHDSKALQPIEGVPVMKQRFLTGPEATGPWGAELYYKPFYKPGDVVLCVCGQRSLDDMFGGSPYDPGGARIFNAADAVIVGVVKFS